MTRYDTIKLTRSENNPVLSPHMVKPSVPDWEVIGAFNAGIAQYKDEVIMLVRVAERPVQDDPNKVKVPVLQIDRESEDENELPFTVITLDRQDPQYDLSDSRVVRYRDGETAYLTSISHLRVARSRDGINFEIDDKPTIMPSGRLEMWGIEDPRITPIDDQYLITYSAASDKGVCVGLLKTTDFATFERMGIILAPTNKDVVIFPERINGRYQMLHRPVPSDFGYPEIWLAESEDLKHWGNHQFVMGVRPDTWENARIGASCIPIRTDEGWLILYHGADEENRYGMNAALLDLEDPTRVIARLDQPFMIPEASYEKDGFFSNVVFACGAIVDGDDIIMYYGAADEHMARATFKLSALLELLRTS